MAPYAVSLVLIRVDYGVQRPVYYVSKSLHEAEVRYLPLEKTILAVVLGTRKLPHYFQAHTIVLTQLQLKAILRSADYTRRVAKFGTILGAFDIKYMPRTSIKGKVLTDLVAKFTEPPVEELKAVENMDKRLVGTISKHGFSLWEVYVDGASNQKGSRVELVLISPEKVVRVLFFLYLILFEYHLFIPLLSYWVFPNIFCSIISLITNISYLII